MCGEQLGFVLMHATVYSALTTRRPDSPLHGGRPGTEGVFASTESRDRPVPARLPRVLFVYPFPATFIQRDLTVLQTFCEVRPLLFSRRSQYPTLLKSILSADIIYCWFALPFAAVAAIAARLLGKKVIVVAGGWDIARIPELGYGRLLTKRGLAIARLSLGVPDLVLAFSESSKTTIREVAPRSPVRLAYLGVDADLFHPTEKEDLVVTVAQVSRENVRRKGLRTLVDAAKEVPDARFIIVGRHLDDAVDELRTVGPSNVRFIGEVSDTDLREILGRARVYVQASYTEGFGVALAEAMASGCVPVVTRRGAIPEVVGDTGLYVDYGDPHELAHAIREGLHSQLGARARARVLDRFTIARRLDALRKAVLDLADGLKILQEGDRGD